MSKDLSISLIDRPGTLAAASDALGRAGINIDGVAGYTCDGRGTYHVLVDDAERARRALIDAGFEILEERRVAVVSVADRPGAAAALLRHVAEAGVNVDLMYLSATGRLVLGGPDVPGIERALG